MPLEYHHTIKTPRETKTVVITSPLKWVVYYTGFPPAKLRELLNDRNRSTHALQSFVLHTLIMGEAASPTTGIGEFLDGLRFPATAFELPELGGLPLTVISTSVSTFRPPDALILESTEISGRNSFEEVIQLDDLLSLRDPLKDELLRIVEETTPELLDPVEEAEPEAEEEPEEEPEPPPPPARPTKPKTATAVPAPPAKQKTATKSRSKR
jgi:hypothetical protein